MEEFGELDLTHNLLAQTYDDSVLMSEYIKGLQAN